jgi:hypothetical protein
VLDRLRRAKKNVEVQTMADAVDGADYRALLDQYNLLDRRNTKLTVKYKAQKQSLAALQDQHKKVTERYT